MRPRLHPDMGPSVLCARVAVQMAVLYSRLDGQLTTAPSDLARGAARTLPLDYPGFLKFALHSLSVYLDNGYRASVWLNCVLEAAHYGHSFRRCFFFDYKDNRSPYPRVTNRGVQDSSKAAGGRVRKGRLNA